MSEKHKKTSKYLNWAEQMPILASTTTGCVSISPLTSLVDGPAGIASSAVGLKICGITAWIKKYKAIITERRRRRSSMIK